MQQHPTPTHPIYTATALETSPDNCWPNSTLPAIVYSPEPGGAAPLRPEVESRLADNGYSNTWEWTVYDFEHYHSNTHEVLVCMAGCATLVLGGPAGTEIKIHEGMAVLIPAGVAHKRLTSTGNFAVLGAYPEGMQPDMRRGACKELAEALENIHAVPVPEKDPIMGVDGGITALWKRVK